jgi:cyclophilin family peptidyl-prolyl cis-trans isomerase
MPRSRRLRKSQNQVKPEWGKNNPQTKAKNKKIMIALGIIAVAAVVLGAFLFAFQGSLFPSPSVTPSPSPSVTPSPSPSATPSITSSPAATPLTSPTGEYSSNGSRVLLMTSMGNITVQLRDDKPITADNFLRVVREGLYTNTIFHRVIKGFMIQGGGIGSTISTIPDEIGNDNRNTRGTIAMAKTDQPNSATSQFFINLADNGNNQIDQAGTRFDTVYTVFGQVIQGMDIVDAIANVPVTTNPIGEVSQPVNPVTLIAAFVL